MYSGGAMGKQRDLAFKIARPSVGDTTCRPHIKLRAPCQPDCNRSQLSKMSGAHDLGAYHGSQATGSDSRHMQQMKKMDSAEPQAKNR